jgi:hypothetical protein
MMKPMSRTSLFRVAFVAAMAVAAPLLPACSSDDAPAVDASLAEVVRQGDVTDVQLRAVVANAPIDWAWAGGQFDTPDPNATLPSSTPFEFTWHADATQPEEGGGPSAYQMVHLLVFSTPTKPNLLRVFSTLDSYTPDDATWQLLTATGEPITLSLTSGTFAGDDLTSEGGPYIGQHLTFTIE